MELRGNIKFADAIIVNEKLLLELEKIIYEFYEDVSYEATLCNEDKIKFENLGELISYENIDERKIERLDIDFGRVNSLTFTPTFSMAKSYQYTVTGNYKMNNSDKSIVFSNKVNSALKKNSRPKWYTFLTKFSIAYFLLFLLIICGMAYVYEYIKFHTIKDSSLKINYLMISMLIGGVLAYLFILLSKIRNYLFPCISYMIGEQINKIQKKNKLYENIFWGIIVTFVISVICSFIC